MIKKVCIMLLCVLALSGCKENKGETSMKENSYNQITAEEAKAMLEENEDYILLDVRSQEEFNEGHIEGALVIPDTEIKNRAEAELTDKQATILVYCRSGRRSKNAAQALTDLGYTGIYEFGGILDWPYEIVQ